MFDQLSKLLGDQKVFHDKEILATHSTDKWYASASPDVVVMAESNDDVVKTLQFSQQNKIPVTTRGAGVGYVGGCVPAQGGIALSLAKMNRILEVNLADAVAVVEPGVITGDLATKVKSQGWYYPPDPASLLECSLGGNIATNAGGPRCLKYGVTRNYVLGLEAVLANGDLLRTGSRCHKNKTGFDLHGLLVGSEGMLGVVTQATLRLIPHPQTRAMLTCTFATFPEAAQAVHSIFQSHHLPSALEIADGFTIRAAREYLGASSLPKGNAHLIVEIDGRAQAVEHELRELQTLLQHHGGLGIEQHPDESACESVWQLRRDFSYSLRHTGLTKLNEDIVLPRSKLVKLVEFAEELEQESGIPLACFGHAGDGNIHVNLMVQNYDDPSEKQKADLALDRLFKWVFTNQGVITGEHGIGLAKKPWFTDAISPEAFRTHQSIKKALDPHNLLNPGKFLD